VTGLVASIALLGIALPHLVRLHQTKPATAATLWIAALTIRALASISLGVFALLVFPDTSAYRVLTHWCEHAVTPVLGLHLAIQGHAIGAVGVLVPLVGAGGALVATAVRTGYAMRSLHEMLSSRSLGAGPAGSVIVGGPDVVVAAAGLMRPKVVVSAGALATLDDEELAAGLAHEHGHIQRRHHLLLAYAEVCRALARILPGTRRAVAEFRFQLERDADDWALRHHHDPCALASAICKAATFRPTPTVVGLGSGALERRVDELMASPSHSPGSWRRRAVDTAAVLMVSVAISSAVALPAEALAGGPAHVVPHSAHHCAD
jgi:Zn-dependent protease with chaperone function